MKTNKNLWNKVIVMAGCFIIMCNDVAMAQGDDLFQLKGQWGKIMGVAAFMVGVLAVVGAIHVYAAKSADNAEKFKSLLVRYIGAIVFILLAMAAVPTVYKAIAGQKL